MSTSEFKITPFKKIIELTENNDINVKEVKFKISTSAPFQYAITEEHELSKPVIFKTTENKILEEKIDVSDNKSRFIIIKTVDQNVLDASVTINTITNSCMTSVLKWIKSKCTFYNIILLILLTFFLYFSISNIYKYCKKNQKQKVPLLDTIEMSNNLNTTQSPIKLNKVSLTSE